LAQCGYDRCPGVVAGASAATTRNKGNKPMFSKKGCTCGFDNLGRSIIGWFGKDKSWHVAQIKETEAEYLTNGTHKTFDNLQLATDYAKPLIDVEKTKELKWWT
jgi:hypothetical protein